MIENKELYNSDEGEHVPLLNEWVDKDQELDLGEMKREKREVSALIKKIKNKKVNTGASMNIGLVQSNVTANELAAKGIKLSIKEELMAMTGGMVVLEKKVTVESVMMEDIGEEEEDGLVFVDPTEEKRVEREKQMNNNKDNNKITMIKLKDGTLVPSSFQAMNGNNQ